MAANDTLGLNQVFQIYHEDGSAYEGLVMHKSATDSVVMSLGDSITGDVYWRDNELALTMKEYITYNGVNYVLVNPPTIVREGMVADNSELKGMTKYSFKFYHPMYQLGNFPFSDVAVTNDQKKFLSENKTFSWIGTANDYLAKLNKNLEGTQWMVEMSSNFPNDKKTEMSDVLAFDKNTVADALKVAYDTWGVPYVIDVVTSSEASYNSGKRFKVVWGLPSNEIYENATKKQQGIPYIFKMGKGVGLKNNSRTPRNNKIITRIAGYGSETNIPYGYPQIVWTGNQSWDYTINNSSSAANSYPIYDGIVGGQKVRLIKHPFTRTHLMPNVYVDAVNKKVNPNATGYDPNIELKDYYDATAGEDYPNPINLNAPSYDIHEFDDIKPELGSESIVSVTPLNPDLTPASSWDDTMDDDGNFIQSYFQITLPTLSFDIYACAAITEAMEINMRSGACLGCTFPVEVDWEDYKANFYNEDGEFDPVIHSVEGDGHVRNGKKYPDSSNSSTPVTLILKKENTTFGVLMPNTYQHPATGDQFVVLGISLPTSYITNAQTRLDNAMKSFMLENNVHYYDYPLKFDEAFLRNNTYILEQLKPNAIVRFEFAGETLPLYVKQMNVKFGEGVLPKYDITLTDNVEVVLNQIGQVADDVERLASLISILRQSYGSNVWVELAKKLSKTDDDTAQGFIRFVKGLQVGERFDSGLLGEGGVFRKDADGTTYIEADKLYIRMKAYFDTVEIRKYMHSGGNRIASPAGAKCVRVDNMAWYATENKFVPVDEYGTYRKKDINGDEQVIATGLTIVRYRCYFRGEDNDGDKVTNDFVVGDQAYCHITNGATNALQMHHYWRTIVARNTEGSLTEDGEFWIDLANYFTNGQPATLTWVNERGVTVTHKSHQAGSDIPRAQDDIVQLGSADDVTRQGAIIEYSSGEDSPSYKIYQNIDDFSFENTNFIALGYNTQTGRAYMNVYGDAYIGDPDESTFIKYEQENSVTHRPKMTIRAEVEFQDPDDPTSITTLEQFANTVITDIDNIQSQIDGELDTWYYAGIPTLNNLPASQWTTDDLKKMHVGDLYYDKDSGFVYRFIYDTSVTPNVYKWIQIHDDAISEALKQAEKAQDTADHKRRVFVTQPPSTSHPDGNYVEYDVGDLWANATGTFTYVEEGQTKTVTYNNDLLRCRVSKPIRNASGVVIDGTFSITDWELATRYTDDTKIDAFLDGYQGNLTAIRNQIDQKAETYYEDNDPSTNQWGSEHVGDMWFCTSDHADPSMFKKGTTWVWQEYTNQTTGVVTYAWAEAQIPQVVFDTLDRKKAIYVAWNAWITTDSFGVQHNNLQLRDLFIPSEDTTGSGVQYKANRVYRCVSLNPTTFQEIDYVDNQDWSNWIQNTYNQNISNIESQLDKKAETWYQNVDPSTTASPNGWYGEDNAEHVGDLWLVNIDVTGSNIYKAGTTWYFKDNGDGASPRYTWEKQVVPQEVFDYADGKAAIFVGNPPTTYNINDMWFIGDGVSSSQLPTGCVAGDVVVSSAKRTGVYNKADWTKKDRYTDDTKFNTYISQIINGTSDQSDSAVVAQALHAIKAALNENTTISGGLILTSLISLKSNSQVWAGISGLYDANETGGGIAAWYGGGRVDHEAYPSSSDYAKSLFRFDGSGYVASGNITWNANGAVTIKNITTLSDSQNTNLLNELATFNSAFTFTTSGSGSTTVLSITPNVPFTALTILDTSVTPNVGRPVATQKWVSDNYVSLAFFNALFTAYSDAAGTNAIDPKMWTAQTAINNLKIMVGAWTNQYLSAYGFNSTSGGGGMSESAMWSALGSSTGTYGSSQINASHLTTALSGYATESWVGNRGYVLQVIEQNEQNPYPKSSGIVTLPASWKKSEFSLKNITAANNLGWVGTSEDGKLVVTSNTLAFWNGLYDSNSTSSSTHSNLEYCKLGQFGALAVKDNISFAYITNIVLSNVSDGDVLKFDAATNKWVNGAGGSVYTLPLAASGTRGGVQIGYTTDATNRNYAIQLSSEKMFVNVPWTDTLNTAGGDQNSALLYLVGMPSQTTDNGSARTYTKSACYIGTDSCLYSNGSKVLTAAETGFLPLTGGTLTGGLQIFSTAVVGGWAEGIRMHVATNNWCGVVMCGDDNTGSTGTSAKTWGIHNNNGDFWINKNGSNGHTGYEICNINGNWGIATTSPSYKLHVDGAGYFSGQVYSEGLLVATYYNMQHNNVAMQAIELNSGGGLTGYGGYIDFHYNGNESIDFTTRIIEDISGRLKLHGSLQATGTISIHGGTSSQFLKADGSLDSNTYLTSASDTKNTAGGDQNSALLYLVGMPSQTTDNGSARTYTKSACYIGTDNCLYSNGSKVLTSAETGFLPIAGGILSANNQWLTPAKLQMMRADSTAYTDRACIGVTDGNIHIDSYPGHYIYLNHYSGLSTVFISGNIVYHQGNLKNVSQLTNDSGFVTSDTLNTAGGDQNSSLLYLVGMPSQTTDNGSARTYTKSACYIGTDNCLYSNNSMVITQNMMRYGIGTLSIELNNEGILQGFGGFIDFHFNGSSSDYTSRIIEGSSGVLSINSFMAAGACCGIGGLNGSYSLYVAGTGYFTGKVYSEGNEVLTSGDVVTTNTNQTLSNCTKTLYNTILTSNFGAKFESICIACGTDGYVGTHSGEINRFSGDLHLQYDGSWGVTMFNKLRFSLASGNTYLTSNGAYFTITVGSASHAIIDYAWVVSSDMRRKDVIMNAGASIEQIADAPIFYYRLKGSPETTLTLGSSAQYWQQVFPNAISENPDGFLSMDYSSIALASAVVTARKVQNHEERIRDLENENRELREEIRLLKKAA